MAKAALAKKEKGGKLAKKGQWKDVLAKYAQKAADIEQVGGGTFISIRGGVMTLGGNPVKGNNLQAVVIDHCYENAFYEGGYDEDAPKPPVCFAFARESGELVPHEKSTKPQSERCEGCPNNAFGSAVDDKGKAKKGKACKNIRRLMLLSAEGMDEDTIKSSEPAFMKLPVTSCRGWGLYVKGLANEQKLPPFAVVTQIGVQPDQKRQVAVTFEHVEDVDENLMDAIMDRRGGEEGEKTYEQLAQPYAPAAEEDEKPAKGKKGAKAEKQKGKKAVKF